MAKLILGKVLKKHGLSKRQFAKRLEIPYKYVFRYFREGYDPKLSTMQAWAIAIPCKISDLYSEARNRS